jgi:hypothetical protein
MLPITMHRHDTRSPINRPPLHLDAGPTAAVFTWTGDRWSHRITTEAGGETDGWNSLDGAWPPANDPRWPASPALVELSRVALPRGAAGGGSALVGVGLAGRSHFSASIAPDPQVADAIRFEIACRLHAPPIWLGSTYRAGGRLIQLTALDDVLILPRTVIWTYSIGPEGVFGLRGAVISTDPA